VADIQRQDGGGPLWPAAGGGMDILMKLNTIVIVRAFSKKVGVDRLRSVVTEGAFNNV
jgi:hypothetical protein